MKRILFVLFLLFSIQGSAEDSFKHVEINGQVVKKVNGSYAVIVLKVQEFGTGKILNVYIDRFTECIAKDPPHSDSCDAINVDDTIKMLGSCIRKKRHSYAGYIEWWKG